MSRGAAFLEPPVGLARQNSLLKTENFAFGSTEIVQGLVVHYTMIIRACNGTILPSIQASALHIVLVTLIRLIVYR